MLLELVVRCHATAAVAWYKNDTILWWVLFMTRVWRAGIVWEWNLTYVACLEDTLHRSLDGWLHFTHMIDASYTEREVGGQRRGDVGR